MRLVDEVVAADGKAGSAVVAVKMREEWCESWAAIEYLAQASAAAAGAADIAEGHTGEPRIGFLLGTRKLELFVNRFTVGERYLVKAECTFSDREAAAFECTMSDSAGNIAARATLNAYRPDSNNFQLEDKQ